MARLLSSTGIGYPMSGAKRALVISSEGATDRAAYERIVGRISSC